MPEHSLHGYQMQDSRNLHDKKQAAIATAYSKSFPHTLVYGRLLHDHLRENALLAGTRCMRAPILYAARFGCRQSPRTSKKPTNEKREI
jgi:hypothetical protein